MPCTVARYVTHLGVDRASEGGFPAFYSVDFRAKKSPRGAVPLGLDPVEFKSTRPTAGPLHQRFQGRSLIGASNDQDWG